jgi:hypothetical protein
MSCWGGAMEVMPSTGPGMSLNDEPWWDMDR